eukprot:1158049-Pelagomonas_calceolata.AAC.9
MALHHRCHAIKRCPRCVFCELSFWKGASIHSAILCVLASSSLIQLRRSISVTGLKWCRVTRRAPPPLPRRGIPQRCSASTVPSAASSPTPPHPAQTQHQCLQLDAASYVMRRVLPLPRCGIPRYPASTASSAPPTSSTSSPSCGTALGTQAPARSATQRWMRTPSGLSGSGVGGLVRGRMTACGQGVQG